MNKYILLSICFCYIFLHKTNAQILDTLLNKKSIKLVGAKFLVGTKNGDVEYNRLLENVTIEHDGSTLTCDSAHLYLASNYVEAFGNAHVLASNGADIHADKILYNGNTNKVTLTNNVSIVDKENSLQADRCDYNLKTKYATFDNGGTLQSDNTTVSSNTGTFNGFTKDAHFTGDVIVTNPKYEVYSQEIKYNTARKIVHFVKETTIISDGTTITGKKGTYNTLTESGTFNTRTLIQNTENDIEANSIVYNKQTGQTNANGNVVINDFKNETLINAASVNNNSKTGISNASGNVHISDSKNQQEIYANKVSNNTKTGDMHASGKVHISDLKEQREIFADKVFNNDKTGIVNANGNVQIYDNKNQRDIFANAVDNNKITGDANAKGNVVIDDFKEHRLMKANEIKYNQKHQYINAKDNVLVNDSANNNVIICKQSISNQFLNYTLLLGRPLIKSLVDADSLFMKADSFFIAPVVICDTIKKFYVPTWAFGDTLEYENTDDENNTKPEVLKTIMALGNVKIFSDSMQAICDSLTYNQKDSVYRLYKNPILWTRGSQAMGDTMHLHTVNNKMNKVNMYSNSLVVNYTGDSNFYNQISGVNIIANIVQDALQDMDVVKNAQSIYFRKDDELQAYDGMVQAKSTTMRVLMKNKDVSRIILYTDPDGVFYPMPKVTQTNCFLDTYKWLDSKRPKNKLQLD